MRSRSLDARRVCERCFSVFFWDEMFGYGKGVYCIVERERINVWWIFRVAGRVRC